MLFGVFINTSLISTDSSSYQISHNLFRTKSIPSCRGQLVRNSSNHYFRAALNTNSDYQIMNKAFFLDRDGTINVDYNYVHKPEEWTWCKGALDAIRWMNNHDYKIIIVTNQSGIARGRYTEEHVKALHDWVDAELKKQDLRIDDWYYAPHHPEHDAEEQFAPSDRKPDTGMFEKAARKHDISFAESYMAGDKISDLKPAIELGMTPFFIRSRHEPNQDKSWLKKHDIPIFNNIKEVIDQL